MNKASSIVLTLAAAVAFLSSCKPSQPAAAPEPDGDAKARRHTRLDTCGRHARLDTCGGDARFDAAATPLQTARLRPRRQRRRRGNPGGIDSRTKRNAGCGRGQLRSLELKDPVATVDGDKISKAQLDEAFDKAVQMTGVKAADLTSEQKMEGYRQTAR